MTDKFDKDIDRLFSEELMPLAARLKRDGVKLLETRLENGASSYFVRRSSARMTKIDFENGGCSSPDALEAELTRLWGGGTDGALAVLAPGNARLARTLRRVEEETGDVSDFVYVMY